MTATASIREQGRATMSSSRRLADIRVADSVFNFQLSTFNFQLPLLACAACFGQSDSPLAHGFNWGIISLLGVVIGVLGAFSTFFVFLAKRSAMVATSASQTTMQSAQTPSATDHSRPTTD